MKISINEAKDLITKVLAKHGYDDEEITEMSKVILYSALREKSQGMPKLFGWHIEKDKDAKKPIFTQVTNSIGRYDAQRNNSMFVCNLAVEKLIPMAKEYGLASIGIYNNNNSSGAIGYYTKKLADNGLIGIMFASSDPVGAIGMQGNPRGVLGSNPIAISVPWNGSDITHDISTTKYTWGDLVEKATNNEKLEEGFAFDKDGNPTTDPKEAMDGSVASFDGTHKGLGLAFMIQIIAGSLIGSKYEQSDTDCDYGNLMIAINPEKFAGREFLNHEIDKLVKVYKNSDHVFLPGERGNQTASANLQSGGIEISEALYEKIQNFVNS